MPRSTSQAFRRELPLKTDAGDERACAIIQDAGRTIGNAGAWRRIAPFRFDV
jgi:hypothetical protein